MVGGPSPERPSEVRELGTSAGQNAGRGAAIYLIRNTQQELVALSNQADIKASIVITAAAIVLGLAVNNVSDKSIRWSLVTLAVLLLVSMFLAIVAVIPKHRRVRVDAEQERNAFNPLFFGHFSSVSEDSFVSMMKEVMRDNETIYQAQLRDLHAKGVYVEKSKLRFLRWSYAAFFAAFLVASAQQVITVVVR